MLMLKSGIRILALEDAPFTRKDKKALVVGVVGRKGVVEGVLSFSVDVDGNDATERLITRVKTSRFLGQIRLIAVNGISFAGLNIIDIVRTRKELGVPVMAVTRKRPRRSLLKGALRKGHNQGTAAKIKTIDAITKAAVLNRVGGFYVQSIGLDGDDVASVMDDVAGHLRLAHIICSGIVSGESRGRM